MAPVLETSGLTKRFGDTVALDALDLRIEQGEVLGFLGPNGAGKTTTIRLLLGLIRPTAGSARLFGLDAWSQPLQAHRRLALVTAIPRCGRSSPRTRRSTCSPVCTAASTSPTATSWSSASTWSSTRRCARSRPATARRSR
jgi:ABC-type branched-subunit amino acid transport system ATPase component